MRCQQYQEILADKCPREADCQRCGRCATHCFCATIRDAIKDAVATYDALRPALLEEIRVADIATLWDAGIKVADDEFDGDKFRV